MIYKESQNRRPKTLEGLRRSLDLLEIYVDEFGFTPASFVQFDAWLLNRRNAPGSVSLRISLIGQFLRWCRSRGYMTRDLCEDICDSMNRPDVPSSGNPTIFTHADYLKLKKAEAGTPIEWAFILAYHTGLALVDCCHLRWTHVDMDRLWIKCARIKLQRLGAAAITEMPIIADSDLHLELLKFQEAYRTEKRNEEESDYVCPELMKLYSWKDSNFRQTMSRIIRRHTGAGRTFHTFRRTFVSNVVNSGMSTALACKLTAHSDPKMLMRYLRPDENALRAGVEKAFEQAKLNHHTK